MSFKGITEKKLKDGTTAIMVRFKHNTVTYPVKNFTRLFGCNTKTQARHKLVEVKSSLSRGLNPFVSSRETLNEIWEHKVEKRRYATGKEHWRETTIRNYTSFYDIYLRKPIGNKKLEKITYQELKDIYDGMLNRNFTTFFHPFHKLPSTFLTVKQAYKIVA